MPQDCRTSSERSQPESVKITNWDMEKILLLGKGWAALPLRHSKTDIFHEKKAAKAHFDIYII
jgi:hypothetical protein